MADRVKELSCDCPYAESSKYCKHEAAVLFAYDSRNDSTDIEPVKKDSQLEKLLESISPEELRDFLTKSLAKDLNLANDFRLRFSTDKEKVDASVYVNRVDEIYDDYTAYDEFIDYEDAYDFASELDDLVSGDGFKLLEGEQFEAAFQLSQRVYSVINVIAIDDSDGGLSLVAASLGTLWTELIAKADASLREKMFQWVSGYLRNQEAVYNEELEATLGLFVEADLAYKKQVSAFVGEMIRSSQVSEDDLYTPEKWLEIKLELIDSPAELAKLYHDFWRFPIVRQSKFHQLEEDQQWDAAIAVLKESIQLDHEFTGLVRIYHEQLKEIYLKQQRFPEYEQELWALMLKFDRGSVELFQEMKDYFPKNEWPVIKAKIYAALKDCEEIDQLYVLEADWKLLLKFVQKAKHIEPAIKHMKELSRRFPKELLTAFEEKIKQEAEFTSDRRHYHMIGEHLLAMRKIPGGTIRSQLLAEDLIKKYYRRKAMADEIRRVIG